MLGLTPRAKERLSLLAYHEPLSAGTDGRRKALLFTTSFSILLTVYGVEVKKTPWLDLEVPPGAPDILHGAMAFALLYTLLWFAIHVLTDWHRWRASGDILDMVDYEQHMRVTNENAKKVGIWVERLPPAEAAQIPQYGKMVHLAKEYAAELERLSARARVSHATLTWLQVVRLVTVDVGGPLLAGLFAFNKIGPALWPFLAAIFSRGSP